MAIYKYKILQIENFDNLQGSKMAHFNMNTDVWCVKIKLYIETYCSRQQGLTALTSQAVTSAMKV